MHAFIVNSNYPKIAQNPDTLVITEMAIENIRSIPGFLSKRPLKEKVNKVFLENAHQLSIIAQNAMLKILEEPTGDSEIYLITDYPDQLLPTILSRVQMISSLSPRTYIKRDLNTITTRDELLEHLDYLENEIHTTKNNWNLYKTICETRKYTKANCNLKLCIAHLASRL